MPRADPLGHARSLVRELVSFIKFMSLGTSRYRSASRPLVSGALPLYPNYPSYLRVAMQHLGPRPTYKMPPSSHVLYGSLVRLKSLEYPLLSAYNKKDQG